MAVATSGGLKVRDKTAKFCDGLAVLQMIRMLGDRQQPTTANHSHANVEVSDTLTPRVTPPPYGVLYK
jgi:hypothetical protein